MKRQWARWIDYFVAKLPHESLAFRARTRFFVGLLLAGLPLLAFTLLLSPLNYSPAIVASELLLAALVSSLLLLLRAGYRDLALWLYSIALPLLFVLRYWTVAVGPGSNLDPLYSDYLLVYAILGQVMIALTSARTRELMVSWAVYAVAGSANLYLLVAPANPGRLEEVLVSVQLRYHLLLGLITLLLAVLQNIIRKAVRQAEDSEKRLEAQVEQRTKSLRESQARLEGIRAALAAGEKFASLDRLMAGVAHEVNTPLGAIQASQTHLARRLPYLFLTWTGVVLRNDHSLIQVAMEIVRRATYDATKLDSRAVRENRKQFEIWLAAHEVPQAAETGQMLAELGLGSLDVAWLPLLSSPQAPELLAKITELVEVERSVHIIGVSASKAAAQVAALRKYAQPPRSERTEQRVDLEVSLTLAANLVGAEVKGSGNLTLELSSGLWVLADPERLLQIWVHLATNAFQALPAGGAVCLRSHQEGDWAVVEVVDNGRGIPLEIQQRIREPFFGLGTDENTLGMGLEIVRMLVQELHGGLEFTSEPGSTQFRVRLPILN